MLNTFSRKNVQLTITNLWFTLPKAEIEKAARTHEQREKYVFKMARCLGSPSAAAALLKLGQNIHKKIVPIIENMSDVLAEPWK